MGRCALQECASRRVHLDTEINIISFFSLMVKNVRYVRDLAVVGYGTAS
ncbi:hypothetical protein QUA70_22335 [Microcoleus sp. LAD1_D5]